MREQKLRRITYRLGDVFELATVLKKSLQILLDRFATIVLREGDSQNLEAAILSLSCQS